MSKLHFYFLSLLLVGLVSCRSTAKKSTVSVQEGIDNLIYLNVEEGGQAILDNTDGFFDQITINDICIQMKKEDCFDTRSEAVVAYKAFLKEQILPFSNEDREYMDEVFTVVNKRLRKLNPKLVIPKLELVKIKLDHYGPDAYYTRGKSIFLPSNTLERKEVKGQTNVMLHEVWHILSRYDEALRNMVYQEIGFKPHNLNVKLPESMAPYLLTNPDGVRMDYSISLDDTNVLPIITMSKRGFTKAMPRFFDYISFDLYKLNTDGLVEANDQGKTTVSPEKMQLFFNQIKDNTQYIIHPDEITADNFMLAVNAYDTGEYDGHSEEGKALILSITDILKKVD